MAFVHLHCRTHYSFLDGAMSPAELVEAAVNHGMPAIAMTDSSNLCGMVEFYEAATKAEIKPLFGAEVWIGKMGNASSHQLPAETFFGEILVAEQPEEGLDKDNTLVPAYQLVFLVMNDEGYHNLCTLLTLAHRQRYYTPLLSLEQVTEHAQGLLCFTSGEYGPVALLPTEELHEHLRLLQETFSDRFYIELMDWGIEEHERHQQRARQTSAELGIPLLATNSCRYSRPEHTALYNTLRNIATGASGVEHDYDHPTDQATVKSEAEMLDLFEPDVVHISSQIADQIDFTPSLGGTYLPNSDPPNGTRKKQWTWLLNYFPLPKAFGDVDTSPPSGRLPKGWSLVDYYFAWYARIGLQVRLDNDPAVDHFGCAEDYKDQLEMEIGVIQRMKFPTYHLIVAEFTNWAKDNDIAVGPGRGSAAGSVVVWSMRITDINPRQFGLMFERYLNPDRISMPDIDMDFEQEQREKVIDHAREKYGDACVAQILTIGKMKAKAALKDAARACSVHFLDADKWSKKVPDGPKVKLWPSIQESELLKALWDGDPTFHRIATLARGIEGRPRQTGVHAAGVIITSRPVSDFIPLHFDGNISMTGLEMTGAEKMGLVKFDFLGLKNLDIIKEATRSIEQRTGKKPTPIQPLFDDPEVYKLITSGDTLGLFQVESHGMQNLVRRMKPDSMEDLVAILALYRPGPLGSGMVDQYIECKHRRMKVQYPHELLTDALQPTHGVIVYQEQVMRSAQALAGFTLAQADLLRRAMGKKKQAEMDKQRSIFVEGCQTNGIDEADATRIFNLIDHFAGYGFNKSHSASYAVITYITAYLKAHHRADFMAAAMTFEAENREKLVAYVHDTQHAQIRVIGPDINLSDNHFTAHANEEGEYIRFGLGAIKGVGTAALTSILRARQDRPFASMADLQERTSANKTVLQALIYSGALDSIEPDRFEAWWTLNKPQIKSELKKKDCPDQLTLFGGPKTIGEMAEETLKEKEQEARPDRWTYTDRMAHEAATLGCWLSGHPLDRYSNAEKRAQTVQITSLEHRQRGDTVTIVGVITKIHKIKTRHGDSMTFFTIADRSGMTEVVLRPKIWNKFKGLVVKGDCVGVQGAMDRDGAEGKVIVEDVFSLPERRTNMARQLNLHLPAHTLCDELMEELKEILHPYLRPNEAKGCRLRIIVDLGEDTFLKIRLPLDPVIDVDQTLFDRIEGITGQPDSLRIPGSISRSNPADNSALDTDCVSEYSDDDPDNMGDIQWPIEPR